MVFPCKPSPAQPSPAQPSQITPIIKWLNPPLLRIILCHVTLLFGTILCHDTVFLFHKEKVFPSAVDAFTL
jgi:hypothetical protein